MSRNANGVWAVTGAGQGIGLFVTTEIARRGYEALALVLHEGMKDDVLKATEGFPGKVNVEVLDITKPGDFAFPDNLAVVINNAGIRPNSYPVEETTMEEFRKVLDVNFFGALDMAKRAIPILRKAGRGVICNITSGALITPTPFLAPYRAAKWGLSGLGETLRVELAPFGVRVVEILPGFTESGLNRDSMTQSPAGAVNFPAYKPMAERLFELNKTIFNKPPTPGAQAAVAIVDAILDDNGPMRYGTDEASCQGLENWRTLRDEEIAANILGNFEAIIPKFDNDN